MALHSTARTANVKARIQVYISGLTITGSPAYYPANTPRIASDGSPFLRSVIDFDDAVQTGRFSASDLAYRGFVTVLLDLFFPDGEDGSTVNLYTIDNAADDLADAFRMRSLGFLDYNTSSSSPPAIAERPIRFFRPTLPRRIPPVPGYLRRQITARGEWFYQHS